MEHRGFPDRAVDQIRLGTVVVIRGRNVDFHRAQGRLRQPAPNRPMNRLAADDQDLVDIESAPGGAYRMIDLLAVHRPASVARNSVYTEALSLGDSTPANGVT